MGLLFGKLLSRAQAPSSWFEAGEAEVADLLPLTSSELS